MGNHLRTSDPTIQARYLRDFAFAKHQLNDGLGKYERDLLAEDLDRQLFKAFSDAAQEWLKEADNVLDLSASGHRDLATVRFRDSLDPLTSRVLETLGRWIDYNQDLANRSREAAVTAIDNSRKELVATITGMLIAVTWLGILLFRQTIPPLWGLRAAVESIAKGDYVRTVPHTEANDETGYLARSIEVLKRTAGASDAQTREIERQRNELAGAESWFRQILNSEPDGLIVTDEAGAIVYANRQAEQIFGYGPGELKGLEPEALLPGSMRDDHKAKRERHLAETRGKDGTPTVYVSGDGVRKDGRRIPLDSAISRMKEIPGRPGSICVSLRDISQRQAMERRLRIEEERMRLILESSFDGIYGVDDEGRFTFMNPAGLRILGYDRFEELQGKESHGLIHHHRRDGSVFPARECPLYHARSENKAIRADDEIFWRKDGSPVEVSYSTAPMGREGTRMGSVVCFSDATERKRAEKQLQFNRLVVENAGPMVWIRPDNGLVVYANKAALGYLGYTDQEFLALRVSDWDPDYKLEDLQPLYDQLKASGSMVTFERPHRHKDGRILNVEVTAYALESGGMQMLISTVVDITERKRAEAALATQREFLKRILDTSPVGIAISVNGVIRFANPRHGEIARMQPGTRAESAYVNPEDRRAIVAAMEREGVVRDIETRMYAPDGQIRDVLVTFMNTDFEGEPGLAGWLTDITKLKQAEAEILKAKQIAEEATKAKSDFLANMSQERLSCQHEPRDPHPDERPFCCRRRTAGAAS